MSRTSTRSSTRAMTAICAAVAFAGLTLAAPAAHAGTQDKTKYPVVLVHGFIGFDNILGAVNYFYDVPGNLRKEGATVYIASVNPSQTTEFRGEELIQQMKQWAAKDGVTKFNLIGHSHGGPTVRYAAGTVPGMVASVSTVAGTHFGTVVADELGAAVVADPTLNSLANAGLKLISWLTGNKTTDSTLLAASMASLSTAGSAAFNDKFPAGAPTTTCGNGPEVASVGGNNIRFYSFSGTSVKTNAWDVSDLILDGTATYFKGEANDGLVGRCSSHWGKVIKDNYAWNHLDEINQVLGTIGKGAPDPVAFYVQHVNRLKLAGL